MKTQNLAILLTDIAGFTAATARQTREQNAAWLTMHSQLLRPVFHAFGGTVVKEIGDAFLCVFPSPTDAVLCGTAVLDALWAYNQSSPELMRLNVRVVVHAGEVRLDAQDIYGEPVNVAARVEDVAEGGDVTLTEGVFLTMNRSEVELLPLGSHTLKGLPEPVTLYKVKQGETGSYPYGGRHVARVQAAGASPAPVRPGAGGGAWGRLRERLAQWRDQASRVTGGMAARLVLVALVPLLLAAGGWTAWKAGMEWWQDPFRAVEERLGAGDAKGAGAAWDKLDERGSGPKWRRDYYLGRVSALEGNCPDTLDAYETALEKQAALSKDAKLNADVARCLDGTTRARVMKLVRKTLGRDASGALAAHAKDTTGTAAGRMAALGLLESVGDAGQLDVPEVLLSIVQSDDTCADRREAVLKLAVLRAPSSLDGLKQQLRESDPESGRRSKQNRCMLGALAEAVRTVEEGR